MTSGDALLLHRFDAVRDTEAKRLTHVFDLHLRGAAPAVANAVEAAAADIGGSAAHIILDAVIAVSDSSDPARTIKGFDRLRHAARIAPRQDALLGQALMAALAAVLGDDFRGATREAWSDSYIRLVEIVMASRNNRFELVA